MNAKVSIITEDAPVRGNPQSNDGRLVLTGIKMLKKWRTKFGCAVDESGVKQHVCSVQIRRKKERTYLTRFSDAMTLVETALPRACNSMVS